MEKSIQHLTSSLPLGGSLLLLVTMKFQVFLTALRFIFVFSTFLSEHFVNNNDVFFITSGASLGITSDGFFELETLPK